MSSGVTKGVREGQMPLGAAGEGVQNSFT